MSQLVDAATIQAAMGTGAPAALSLFHGNEASNATDLIGSNNLTDGGTPTHSQTDSDSFFDENVITFTDNSTDSLDAASNTVFDPGSNAFAFVGSIGTITHGAIRSIFAKRDSGAPNNGYEFQTTATGLSWVTDTASGAASRTVTTTDATITFMVVTDPAGNLTALYSTAGDSTAGSFNETCTNTATFSIGQERINCPGFNFGWLAYYETNIPTSTHFDNLKTWLGV